MEPLEDQELNAMLRQWRTPEASGQIRERLFPRRAPWWQRFWQVQIRIPLPVAICAALLLAVGLWRWTAPRPAVELPRAEGGRTAEVLTFRELTPVRELKPRIIRRERAEN
jgi:hypothetical protein